MNIQRLGPTWAPAYRQLMLDAYARHPEAFTSSPAERAGLPLGWWERRLQAGDGAGERVWGATQGAELLGLAKGLLGELLAQAATWPDLRVVQLTVTEGNQAALALYEQAGFSVFGREPLAVAVGDTWFTKLHLWCDLDRLRLG